MNTTTKVRFGSVAEQLEKARITLLLKHAYFASLFYRLILRAEPSIPTMATDGVHLFYNPFFVETTVPGQLVGVLAHEVMHPAFKHHTRRGNRNPKLWNKACDYAINPIIRKAGMELPPDVLDDPRFYGMNAETIYGILEQEAESKQNASNSKSSHGGSGGQQNSSGSSQDSQDQDSNDEGSDGQGSGGEGSNENDAEDNSFPGDYGSVLDFPGSRPNGKPTQEEKAAQERLWNSAIQQASLTAKMAGKMPAGMERVAEEATQPNVPWQEALRKCFYSTLPSDYSWSRPNRRFAHLGLYLPGSICENVGNLVIGVDCSGSISARVLGMFQAELNSLIEETRPNQVDVLYFDEIVQRVDNYQSGEPITLNPVGGGGTNFNPIFDWITERGEAPQALIMLTDLWGAFPTEGPSYPVIWVSTSPRYHEGPFGDTISIAAA